MTTLSKAIYRFSATPLKLPMPFFTELEQNFFTICMKTQKTLNSQSNLEEERAGVIRLPDFRLYYKANQDNTVLAQKQKYNSMSRDNLRHQ